MMIAAKADAKKLLALAKKHEKFLINFRNDLRKEVPKKNALIEESAIDAIMDVFDRHIEPLQMAQTTFFHASNKSVFGAAHKSKRIRAAGKEGGSRPKKKQGIQALAEELVTKYPKSTEEALWRKTSNYSSEDPFETDRFQVYRDEDKLVQFDGAINKETAIASGTFHKEYIRPLKK